MGDHDVGGQRRPRRVVLRYVVSGFSRTFLYVVSGFSRTFLHVVSGFSRTFFWIRHGENIKAIDGISGECDQITLLRDIRPQCAAGGLSQLSSGRRIVDVEFVKVERVAVVVRSSHDGAPVRSPCGCDDPSLRIGSHNALHMCGHVDDDNFRERSKTMTLNRDVASVGRPSRRIELSVGLRNENRFVASSG